MVSGGCSQCFDAGKVGVEPHLLHGSAPFLLGGVDPAPCEVIEGMLLEPPGEDALEERRAGEAEGLRVGVEIVQRLGGEATGCRDGPLG